MPLLVPSRSAFHRSPAARWHPAIVVVALLVGCGDRDPDDSGDSDGGLEAGFEDDLGAGSGCVDVAIYASDADDELALNFSSSEGLA